MYVRQTCRSVALSAAIAVAVFFAIELTENYSLWKSLRDQAKHLRTVIFKEAIHGSARGFSAKYTDIADALETEHPRNFASQ